MEWPDPDCTLQILKILFGNDLGSEVFNTTPDVAIVGMTSILHPFHSGLSSDSSVKHYLRIEVLCFYWKVLKEGLVEKFWPRLRLCCFFYKNVLKDKK